MKPELIARVRTLLAEPIYETARPGSIQLVGGEPGEVVVELTESSITISEYACEWPSPSEPVSTTIPVGRIEFGGLSDSECVRRVSELVTEARKRRLARFRRCRFCGESNPPEWMDGPRVCQTCAEHHLGVVH